MRPLTLVDVTLRDGSHAKSHQVEIDEVRRIVRGLDAAGVPVIEVSHGDGLGGSSYNYGFSLVDELELIRAAAEEAKRAEIAVLLIPGIGVKEDLARAQELGATVARIATHCTEANISLQHITLARELGMTTVGFLMMAHMIPPIELAQQARIMADAGTQVVYVTDSAGALLPDEARARVSSLRAALPDDVLVGMHAHHNLSLSIANSLAAIEAGATWIDAATCGLGAGAGNTPHEVLVAVLQKLGIETGVDEFALMDVAEEVVRPFTPGPQIIDRSSLLLGYAGVYSSFLLHAERAAKRFGVSAKDILIELGRRRTVGGQEDLVLQIAAELMEQAR